MFDSPSFQLFQKLIFEIRIQFLIFQVNAGSCNIVLNVQALAPLLSHSPSFHVTQIEYEYENETVNITTKY